MRSTLLLAGILLCAAPAFVRAQTQISPKPPFTGKDVELWKQLQTRARDAQRQNRNIGAGEPFKVLGNLYSVGVPIGNSFLLTSPEGHILLNTGFAESAEGLKKNIETLGFKITDVKILVPTHWHNDGGGGTAYLKKATGALVYAGVADIPLLEHGGEGNQKIPPVKVDRAIFSGDIIKLGPLSVQAYSIPGHTAGSTSFSFTVREGDRDYRVFQYCCGQNIPDNVASDPNYSEAAMRHTFEVFRKALPVDVYLTGPSNGWMLAEHLSKAKAGDKLAFVDRSTFPAFAAALEVEFEEKLLKSNQVKQ
jgi:metallo-beta-lactamase class B